MIVRLWKGKKANDLDRKKKSFAVSAFSSLNAASECVTEHYMAFKYQNFLLLNYSLPNWGVGGGGT
jgi:hypothetical protein